MGDFFPLIVTILLLTGVAAPARPATQPAGALPDRLRAHVQALAGDLGERNLTNHPDRLRAAEDYIHQTLAAAGYKVERQAFTVGEHEVANLVAEIPGAGGAGEIVIIGAHYDSARGAAGANDNASGVAAVLELAIDLKQGEVRPEKAIRFVLFANEEPPYFTTPQMGSLVHARRCHDRGEKVVAMISMETIGYFSDEPGSQNYPEGLRERYPDTGNFIGIVGNLKSKALVTRVGEAFRQHSDFPAQTGAFPDQLAGVGWSDHWSFWQFGYEAVMVTDTAPFRYPHYHKQTDTPDKLDYPRMAKVVVGVGGVLKQLAGAVR